MSEQVTYDFLDRISFPSSVKIVNPTGAHRTHVFSPAIPITPGSLARAEVQAKTKDVLTPNGNGSWISIMGSPDEINWVYIGSGFTVPAVPGTWGTRGWAPFKSEMRMPADIRFLRCHFTYAPGITWFDDLKIYQDGVLIYENKFTGWWPLTSVLAPIVTGLGVVRFGKKG